MTDALQFFALIAQDAARPRPLIDKVVTTVTTIVDDASKVPGKVEAGIAWVFWLWTALVAAVVLVCVAGAWRLVRGGA